MREKFAGDGFLGKFAVHHPFIARKGWSVHQGIVLNHHSKTFVINVIHYLCYSSIRLLILSYVLVHS